MGGPVWRVLRGRGSGIGARATTGAGEATGGATGAVRARTAGAGAGARAAGGGATGAATATMAGCDCSVGSAGDVGSAVGPALAPRPRGLGAACVSKSVEVSRAARLAGGLGSGMGSFDGSKKKAARSTGRLDVRSMNNDEGDSGKQGARIGLRQHAHDYARRFQGDLGGSPPDRGRLLGQAAFFNALTAPSTSST